MKAIEVLEQFGTVGVATAAKELDVEEVAKATEAMEETGVMGVSGAMEGVDVAVMERSLNLRCHIHLMS